VAACAATIRAVQTRAATPRATSVVSAAKPGTGFARAAAICAAAGRQHEPAARAETVLPSGDDTAVVATTSGVRPPGG